MRPGRRDDQRPHRFAVGRLTKMHRHAPGAAAAIHKAYRDIVGGKALGNEAGDPPRRLFGDFEGRNEARRLLGFCCITY